MYSPCFLSVLCAYRAYEYIFYNIYTICAISLFDLSENFLIFYFFPRSRPLRVIQRERSDRGNLAGAKRKSAFFPFFIDIGTFAAVYSIYPVGV